ncbi:NUDIX domain-containing protein [Paenibacillus sp. LHD-117]|uniref:NUDIX hydrolase n=1 Tax=Paenibacillus sp. LHD-117 TaxID=3071412 RepID=UPI0027E17C22|nr:NUDIX domain-containing protein [Paenibacillus sp. LHD-117]MDQ6421337.1 NUDIX domain-containing protein [Paenibacillus sp. LHD-117]
MPEERFDIYDEDMTPLGTATRSETHANGYWHRSFHCWLIRREGGRKWVRFQRRQLVKDTNPGCYDITVAGHLTAGESMRDAVREIEEEVGVTAGFEELIPLGQVREDASGMIGGKLFVDREVSDVFALVCDLPLSALRLQPEEVLGVYEADLGDMLALFRGELEELEVAGAELAEDEAAHDRSRLTPCVRTVRTDQFVPRDNGYYEDVMEKLHESIVRLP